MKQSNTETKSTKVFQTVFLMVRLLAIYFLLYFGLIYGLSNSKKLAGKLQIITVIAALFAGIITFLWLPKEQRKFTMKGKVGAAAGILLFAAGAAVLLNYLFTVIPWNDFLPKSLWYTPSDGMFDMPFVLAMIGYGVIVPFAEEVCFRGVLFFGFRKMMKVPIAILLSALLFSLYHGSFVQGIYAFIMGVLLGTVAHLTDSLLGSVLFHMAANLIVTAYAYEPKLVDFLKSAPGLVLCALAIIAGGILFALSVSKSKKKEISDQP